MDKIKLSPDEIALIEKQQRGEFMEWDAPEPEQKMMVGIIDKMESLMDELKAYEESGSDPLKWFYGKYKEQQS